MPHCRVLNERRLRIARAQWEKAPPSRPRRGQRRPRGEYRTSCSAPRWVSLRSSQDRAVAEAVGRRRRPVLLPRQLAPDKANRRGVETEAAEEGNAGLADSVAPQIGRVSRHRAS